MDPDPSFHFDADPDLASKNNADPDPALQNNVASDLAEQSNAYQHPQHFIYKCYFYFSGERTLTSRDREAGRHCILLTPCVFCDQCELFKRIRVASHSAVVLGG